MSGFLELFSQYDVLGAFLVNIELTLWCPVLPDPRRDPCGDAHLADFLAQG